MARIESPDGLVEAAVDKTHAALRASLRPLEHRAASIAGGHYSTIATSGLTTVLNAGDRILSLRWTDPLRYFVLQRLKVAASLQTAYGTAQENAVDLVKLTGFTAPDTGGSVILPTAAKIQAHPAHGDTRVNDLRVADATALGAGTATTSHSLGRSALNLANTLGAAAEDFLFDYKPGVGHPAVLRENEGLNVRIAITQGATGVVRFVFTVEWAELPLEVLAGA